MPSVGGRCDLYYYGTTNPVRVADRTSRSFTFTTLPGHPEGPDRFVRFTFYKANDGTPATDIRLEAQGYGRYSFVSEAGVASGQIRGFWQEFADNVGNMYR